MTSPPDPAPTRRNRRPANRWRPLTWAVFALAGGLGATSALNAKGLDLRASSITDLRSVVGQAQERTNRLHQQEGELSREVTRLSGTVHDDRVRRAQQAVAQVRGPAAYAPLTGDAVTVTLMDAPQSVRDQAVQSGDVPVEQLLVHQQDIQAVANALWAGGAEGMTLQKQRVTSTTGIKCVGNTVRLHGVTYAPPYVITAVGDPQRLRAALDGDDYVRGYRRYADAYQLGYAVSEQRHVTLPGYDGSTELHYARVDRSSTAAGEGGTTR